MRQGTKKERAYRQLKQMFLERHFEPDTMLSENDIALKLGMSRTPVREALQLLQSEGFVSIFPKQGVMFKGISTTTVRETLELRAAVEGYVTASCLPLPLNHIIRLEEMLEKQRLCCEIGDVEAYLRHDVVFHGYFVELYNNALISEVIRSINERFISVGLRILRSTNAIKLSFAGHLSIMEAIKASDVPNVLKAVHAHINFGKSQLYL